MTEEVKEILEKHSHWLKKDCDGWKNMRADLRNANLYDANLSGANLYDANLYGADLRNADLYDANLSGADLRNANLRNADLYGADLRNANLYDANLSGANLRNADLRNADLRNADLRNANLRNANLYGANLYGANLYGANLSGADLRNADLRNANLYGANLYGAKGVPYIPMICPEEGSFIGWKKASDKIVKLKIPATARRSSATTRKCRCNKAKVIKIYNLDGTVAKEREIRSDYDIDFVYKVGSVVKVNDFDTNRWEECSTGIHFFMQRQEAINYN